MSSFREAISIGADGIECDIGLTKDLEPVVFHDTKLQRLCGASGRLEDITWKDLKKLRVFGKEPIPHLDELLEMNADFLVNLELKLTAKVEELVNRVGKRLSEIKRSGKTLDRFLISSFSAAILSQANAQLPPGTKYALIFEKFSEMKFKRMQDCSWISQWNVRRNALLQSGGPTDRPYWVWTLNEEADWKKVLASDYPVSAILSDHPDRLGQFLKSFSS